MSGAVLLTAAYLASAASAEVIVGVVRERGTGDPIPDAHLSAGQVSARSGSTGGFTLDLPPGTTALEVRAVGYAPADLVVTTPQTAPLRVFLRPAEAPTEIVVEASRVSPHLSEQVLDRERVEKTPGTFDDPFRLIQALPGVVSTPEYSPTAGLLSIRGAAPTESQVIVDGVQLPWLYHFQQYSSVIHAGLVDEVALYPSAFGSAYGGAIGGVAAVTTRRPDPARPHGGVSVNAINGGAFIQSPAGPRATVSASGRRSLGDLAESGNDQFTVWPVFWDYLARAEGRSGAGDRVSVMGLGAGDGYSRYAGDRATLDPVERELEPTFEFSRGFHAVIVNAQAARGDRAHTASLGWVADRWTGEVADAAQDRQERSVTARYGYTALVSEAVTIAAGGDGRAAWIDRGAAVGRPWPELTGEAPLLSRGLPVDERRAGAVGGVWVEPRIDLGLARVQPGMRVQAETVVGSVTFEPRMAARAAITPAVVLKAAAGRYTQAPSLDDTSRVTGTPTLPVARSDQALVGVDTSVLGRFEVGVEGWGRRTRGATMTRPGDAPWATDGWAAGAELSTRYRMRERFFTWFSATFGHAERDGARFDYDQPFAFSFVASWDFLPTWNLGLRYRYAAGLPFTPIDGGVYQGDDDGYTPILGTLNAARLPNYQKVDVHLDKDWMFRRWTLTGYLEAWWVPARNNAMYTVYSYDYTERAVVAGPSLLPLGGLRATF